MFILNISLYIQPIINNGYFQGALKVLILADKCIGNNFKIPERCQVMYKNLHLENTIVYIEN